MMPIADFSKKVENQLEWLNENPTRKVSTLISFYAFIYKRYIDNSFKSYV